jgi:glycosyltransferase involved in cell wall biosynthesis
VKIAICHQGFAATDAIGNDMAGMYRLLERMHIEPTIVCDWSSRQNHFRISPPAETNWDAFDLIIYHHSQYWHVGDYLVRATDRPILFKYHNITPAHYLAPYFAPYADSCARGREQTDFMLAARPQTWVSDSSFSRDELIEAGGLAENLRVVPPFNRVSELLPLPHLARYDNGPFELLFVGRVTPHKGHLHLLRVTSLLRDHFGRDVQLRIVGGSEEALKTYNAELKAQTEQLDLAANVEIIAHCSDDALIGIYQESHAFMCLSEHEGFNVPVIEAQAIGTPVLGASAGATGETAGLNQLFSTVPRSANDDYFYAALVDEIFCNRRLRDQLTLSGERNVRDRFTDEVIENAFVEEIFDAIGARWDQTPTAPSRSGVADTLR